jgi:hypothetical protein
MASIFSLVNFFSQVLCQLWFLKEVRMKEGKWMHRSLAAAECSPFMEESFSIAWLEVRNRNSVPLIRNEM